MEKIGRIIRIFFICICLISLTNIGACNILTEERKISENIQSIYNPGLTVNFTWRVLYDYTIEFEDTSTGGTVVESTWDFTLDGSIDDSGIKVINTYPSNGLYYVRHYVKDQYGQWKYLDKAIGVGYPEVDFEYEINDLKVTFTDKSVDHDGEITYRGWDFNSDGNFDDYGKEVTFTYSNYGTYLVTLVVQDNDGQGMICKKEITLIEPVADLSCNGNLQWNDKKPGSVLDGDFTVSNIGDTNSKLNWRIDSAPDLDLDGKTDEWSFNPSSGVDLTPNDGFITISVSVKVPDDNDYQYSGNIIIINEDDNGDSCNIEVSISTQKTKENNLLMFFRQKFLERINFYIEILDLF